jgi:hypothetical protein
VEPALTLAAVTQQARRVGHALLVLYIDLATMFPTCNREAVKVTEVFAGLPKRDRLDSADHLYGAHADEKEAVRCRHDSAAGLSDAWPMWVGALMGCVLSPDKSKLLLHSVLVAISAVANRGVRLWGYAPEDKEAAWRGIAQMAFADDWCGIVRCGTFTSERQLNVAWKVWRSWELASGCKLDHWLDWCAQCVHVRPIRARKSDALRWSSIVTLYCRPWRLV